MQFSHFLKKNTAFSSRYYLYFIFIGQNQQILKMGKGWRIVSLPSSYSLIICYINVLTLLPATFRIIIYIYIYVYVMLNIYIYICIYLKKPILIAISTQFYRHIRLSLPIRVQRRRCHIYASTNYSKCNTELSLNLLGSI